MADGTVRGAFDLDTSRAVRGVRDYRREAAAADAQTRQLGSTIDKAFGETQVRQIDRVGSATQRLARDTYETRMEVRTQWRGMRRDIEREAAGIVSTIGVVRDRMRALGRERASPTIDVDGIAKALAQVELLHSRLQSLGRERVTPRVAMGGGGGAVARGGRVVAGGGRGGGSGILNLGGVGFAGLKGGTLAAVGGAALPAVQALAGGTVALGGSLGSAALGAGATGLGGLAPLIAGIGGVMAVAKPAQNALKEAWQQQDRLTKAVQEYGKNSKQARVESERLTRMTAGRPGIGYATTQARGFGRDWRRLTAPGQRQYYGLLGDVAQVGRRAAPMLARDANRAMGATRRSGTQFARHLAGSETQDNLDFFSRTFAQELPTMERTLENVSLTFQRIARAATPFFREANDWVEKQTFGWRTSTRDIDATTEKMRPLVRSAKDWAHLLGTSWDLLKTLGSAGRPAGDSMVVSLDHTFERWDKWMNANPARTRQFFAQSVRSVDRMASGLASAVGYLHQLADVLRPILDRFSQLVGLASSLGLVGAPGSIAALVGGYKGARGRFGSGPAAPMFVPGAGGGGGGGGAAAFAAPAAVAYAAGRGIRTTGVPEVRGPGGVRPLAGQRVYGSGFSYGGPVSQLGPRTTRLGGFARGVPGAVGGAARGAVRGFAPIGLGLAALDFATYDGSFGERAQAGLSSLTLGAITRPRTAAERADAAGRGVGDFMDKQVAGLAPTQRGIATGQNRIDQEIARLNGQKVTSGMSRVLGGDDHSIFGIVDTGGNGITEEQFKENQKRIELLKQERGELAKTNRQMERARNARLDVASRQRATQFGAGLPSAFGVFRRSGQTREQAGDSTVDLVKNRMKHMRDAGVETLGEASLDWARAMAKHHPEMKKQVDELNDAIEARFKRMGRRVRIINGDILTGSRTEWGQIAGALTGASEKARQGVSDDFTAIQQKAVGSLIAMGFSGSDARNLVQGMEKGGRAGSIASGLAGAGLTPSQARATGSSPMRLGNRKARGGMIGGRGLMDTVPTPDGGLAAPGEAWIANRHTLADISRATLDRYGMTAQQMIRGETRQHWKPTRYARGGFSQQTPATLAQPVGGVSGGLSSLIQRLDAMGFHHGSTTSGKHAPNSYHYRGMAVDFGDASNDMRRLWSVLYPQRASFAELFGPSYLSPKPTLMHNGAGFADAALQSQHNDHIHVALTGAMGALKAGTGMGGFGGGAAGGRISLRGVGRRQGGTPGALRQRAGDIYASALEQRINAAIGGGAGGGGRSTYHGPLNRRFPMHLTGTPGVTFSPAQVASIAASVGLPGQTFAQIAHGESGYMPGIQQRDPGDGMVGYGLWQMTPNAWGRGSAAYQYMQSLGGIGAMFNPVRNAEMAKYLYDAAGGSIAPWYGTKYVTGKRATGGRMDFGSDVAWGGMFANGGSMTTNGPTMFMAGEGNRRRERVTVTPAGARGHDGDRLNVTIEAGAVQVHIAAGAVGSGGKADLDAIAEKVGEKIVGKIISGIEKAKRGGLD